MVRLKGGDTAFFSRMASEIAALTNDDINFEIVPGVCSASAAAADLGIPLTAGADFKGLLVASAHHPEALPWASWGPESVSTLALLMAGKSVEAVAAGCGGAGWPQDTPVRASSLLPGWVRKTTCARA